MIPCEDFDLIAFSLGYEMAYSNVLNVLELGEYSAEILRSRG